jgi:hypothetical protein
VNASAKFSSLLTLAMRNVPAAMDSLTLWYAMALCFFFSGDVGRWRSSQQSYYHRIHWRVHQSGYPAYGAYTLVPPTFPHKYALR